MNVKKMIPCIYLYNQTAVKGLNDYTLVNADPVKLALYYAENGSDAILLFDLSEDEDVAHEKALDCIKEICDKVGIPVYGAGNINRMEDVEKLLYAGCAKATLNYSKENNISITQEVSSKFGKDKIMVAVKDSTELSAHTELIEDYASAVIFMYHKEIIAATEMCKLPYIVLLPEISLEKLIEMFSYENIVGISGDVISENVDNINNLRNILKENGIPTTVQSVKVPWSDLKKNSDGHVVCIVQDVHTDEVLMLAYMNEEAYLKTLETGRMTYYSRSRNELWIKGETSGHYQYLQSMTLDCDNDTLLCKVIQVGAACHTGNRSCFFNTIYKKDVKEEKYEICDFLHHCMVLMAEKEITWEEIYKELSKRQ